MQPKDDHEVWRDADEVPHAPGRSSIVVEAQTDAAEPQGGCYGIQVLIAGGRKRWRDEVAGQVRRAGYAATAVDTGLDALSVLVLGLPVDVLVTDAGLDGELCCSQLAIEARALRPNLGIVFAGDMVVDDEAEVLPDACVLRTDAGAGAVRLSLREALAARAA